MDLKDRVAVVTGGAVRIGRALCLALSQQGMRVCLHYGFSGNDAEQTAAEIRSSGGQVTTVQADLVDAPEAAASVMDAAIQAFGEVDVLVNNASIFRPGSLPDLTMEDWEQHHNINLLAPALLSQRFAAELTRREEATGAVINIADWRGLRQQPGHLAYTISKAGLVALTRVLAQELAPRIRVNAIAPGAILPPPDAHQSHEMQMRSVIPLGRTGSPADVVAAVLFLLKSDFITGEVLHVTGGQQLSVPTPT